MLGIPIDFTLNPRTQDVDYVYSSMDIISAEAFQQDKLRTTAWREKFQLWFAAPDYCRAHLSCLHSGFRFTSPRITLSAACRSSRSAFSTSRQVYLQLLVLPS